MSNIAKEMKGPIFWWCLLFALTIACCVLGGRYIALFIPAASATIIAGACIIDIWIRSKKK